MPWLEKYRQKFLMMSGLEYTEEMPMLRSLPKELRRKLIPVVEVSTLMLRMYGASRSSMAICPRFETVVVVSRAAR